MGFVLGMAAYGRTYTLADDRCKELGCPFRSPGLGGCGNTRGFLPFNEIHEYILSESYDELHQDASSSSVVAVVDDDQMISFDDESTWAIKEAYAEMMCLRGTMLWSIDMLKPGFDVLPRRDSRAGFGARLLGTSDLLSQKPCTLCNDSKVHADTNIEYNGDTVSCSDLHALLASNFIPLLSDQCQNILSEFRGTCCLNDSAKTCNICGLNVHGADMELVENRRVSYAGNESTCGDLSASFHLLTKESSFSCSVARAELANLCCEEPCQLCPVDGEMNADAMISYEGKIVTCENYGLVLKTAGFLQGSDKCDSSTSRFSEICCTTQAKDSVDVSLDQAPSTAPCNICERENSRHELKSEALVPYKGTSISCLDLNSILAKSEKGMSEMCLAVQSALFDGCCYEKCSLCGLQSVRFDATVQYNQQILSCDELGSMFTLGTIQKDDDQCDAMHAAYSSTCCFKPPEKKCNLCSRGSIRHEVNSHSFVKTQSSSMHCANFVNSLADREEEDSEVCQDAKYAHFSTCCIASSFSTADADSSYYEWVADHMVLSSDAPFFLGVFFWSLIATFLLCIII